MSGRADFPRRILVWGAGARTHYVAESLAAYGVDVFYGPCRAVGASIGLQLAKLTEQTPESVVEFARQRDALIVGTDQSWFARGIGDIARRNDFRFFGAGARHVALETDRLLAKDVLRSASVPTPGMWTVTDTASTAEALYGTRSGGVVKLVGPNTPAHVLFYANVREGREAITRLRRMRDAVADEQSQIVVEERVFGDEFALALWLSREGSAIVWPLTRTYQRAFDGERGSRTGGMGAAVDTGNEQVVNALLRAVIVPLLAELGKRNLLFDGSLTLDLVISDTGAVSVLEVNTHIGDPEMSAVMRATGVSIGKVLGWLMTCSENREIIVEKPRLAAAEVVVAIEGYPDHMSVSPTLESLARALLAANLPPSSIASFGTNAAGRAASGRLFTVGCTGGGTSAAAETAEDMAATLIAALANQGVRARKRNDIGL